MAHSHLTLQSADSAVDCVNAELGFYLSLRGNATVHCGIRTSVNEPFAYTGVLNGQSPIFFVVNFRSFQVQILYRKRIVDIRYRTRHADHLTTTTARLLLVWFLSAVNRTR